MAASAFIVVVILLASFIIALSVSQGQTITHVTNYSTFNNFNYTPGVSIPQANISGGITIPSGNVTGILLGAVTASNVTNGTTLTDATFPNDYYLFQKDLYIGGDLSVVNVDIAGVITGASWQSNDIGWGNITGFPGVTLPWLNVTNFTGVTLPANNITAGTFATGNYTFLDNVTIGKKYYIGCMNMSISTNGTDIIINNSGTCL